MNRPRKREPNSNYKDKTFRKCNHKLTFPNNPNKISISTQTSKERKLAECKFTNEEYTSVNSISLRSGTEARGIVVVLLCEFFCFDFSLHSETAFSMVALLGGR